MAKPLLDDELWRMIEPLLPKPKRRRKRHPGRKPLDNRKVMTGILFVLKSGIAWEDLPQEMGCGSGMSCWNRLRDWHKAGVWQRVHRELLCRLRSRNKIDFSRAVIDSASVRAVFGGPRPDRAPWTAEKQGRNITCSPMATARRWPRRSRRPTATTSTSSCR
jgi:transposase